MHWKDARGLPPYWTSDNFERIDQAKEIADSARISLPALCLAWVRDFPGVGTVLLGPKHKGHLNIVREMMDRKTETIRNEVAALNELFA